MLARPLNIPPNKIAGVKAKFSQILIKNKHPLIRQFIEYKKNKMERIIDEIKLIDTDRSKDKYDEVKKTLHQYQEVLSEIES